VIALVVLIVWGTSGPLFNFSDTWQLVINTGTTIVTFPIVFLVQRTQNEDALAIHLKLNEIVAAVEGASNRLIDVEDLTEDEIGYFTSITRGWLPWPSMTPHLQRPIQSRKPQRGTRPSLGSTLEIVRNSAPSGVANGVTTIIGERPVLLAIDTLLMMGSLIASGLITLTHPNRGDIPEWDFSQTRFVSLSGKGRAFVAAWKADKQADAINATTAKSDCPF